MWNYAKLAHDAKLAGGPEAFRKNLVRTGNVKVGMLSSLGTLAAAVAIYCSVNR